MLMEICVFIIIFIVSYKVILFWNLYLLIILIGKLRDFYWDLFYWGFFEEKSVLKYLILYIFEWFFCDLFDMLLLL